jgi:hypothetical protein
LISFSRPLTSRGIQCRLAASRDYINTVRRANRRHWELRVAATRGPAEIADHHFEEPRQALPLSVQAARRLAAASRCVDASEANSVAGNRRQDGFAPAVSAA